MPLYELSNARTDDQMQEMARLEQRGICIFCPEGLALSAAQRVLRRTDSWYVTPNAFPYGGASLHLLVVPHRHVTQVRELHPAEQADLWHALTWAQDRFHLEFFGLGVRSGDPRFTGGTVFHLHFHLIVGNVGDPDHIPVRLKLSSRPNEK